MPCSPGTRSKRSNSSLLSPQTIALDRLAGFTIRAYVPEGRAVARPPPLQPGSTQPSALERRRAASLRGHRFATGRTTTLNPDRYAAAVAFATAAHAGQLRKGTAIPYVSHPLAVSGLVLEFGGDEDQGIAGLLHDVVEDCGVSLLEVSRRFGVRVAGLVEGCTDGAPDEHGRKAPWRERKERYLQHLEECPEDTLLVSACDKLHNARCIVSDIRMVGDHVFDRFSASRELVIWYYRRLAGVFGRRLANQTLATILEYEITDMWDFGISGDATRL
jgi:hypothetical protein